MLPGLHHWQSSLGRTSLGCAFWQVEAWWVPPDRRRAGSRPQFLSNSSSAMYIHFPRSCRHFSIFEPLYSSSNLRVFLLTSYLSLYQKLNIFLCCRFEPRYDGPPPPGVTPLPPLDLPININQPPPGFPPGIPRQYPFFVFLHCIWYPPLSDVNSKDNRISWTDWSVSSIVVHKVPTIELIDKQYPRQKEEFKRSGYRLRDLLCYLPIWLFSCRLFFFKWHNDF